MSCHSNSCCQRHDLSICRRLAHWPQSRHHHHRQPRIGSRAQNSAANRASRLGLLDLHTPIGQVRRRARLQLIALKPSRKPDSRSYVSQIRHLNKANARQRGEPNFNQALSAEAHQRDLVSTGRDLQPKVRSNRWSCKLASSPLAEQTFLRSALEFRLSGQLVPMGKSERKMAETLRSRSSYDLWPLVVAVARSRLPLSLPVPRCSSSRWWALQTFLG